MNFEEYQTKFNCLPLNESEQSKTFLVECENKKRVCKKFPNLSDKIREESGYFYIGRKNLLQIPNLTFVGEDFLEIEFIESIRTPRLEESVKGVTKLYTQTRDKQQLQRLPFPLIDLSKDKIVYRLGYLRQEMEKKDIEDKSILHDAKRFVELNYNTSPERCLIHGDLKSSHILINEKGTNYIDLGLISISTPWYDLAFLFMEQTEKERFLEKLIAITFENLASIFKMSLNETRNYLRSGIFYRCLYDFGFALRHRTAKTIKRTMNELNWIIN